jgi:ER membrane protein complex subunit 1, C-terminal
MNTINGHVCPEVANDKNQIQTFSRRLLDPRRHRNKPSAADAEELLTPYDPVVGDDPRHVLSHNSEVQSTLHRLEVVPMTHMLIFRSPAYGIS